MDDSILNDIKSKSSWNLASDEQLIKYLEKFSNHLNDQFKNISNNLNSLSQLSKVTKINLNHVINDFDSAANNQFIENRVYEDDVYIQKNNSPEVIMKKTKEEIEASIISNFKTAITYSLKSLQDFPIHDSSNLSHCIIGSKEFYMLNSIITKIESADSIKSQNSLQNDFDKISDNSSTLDCQSTISNDFNFTPVLNTKDSMNFNNAKDIPVKSKIDTSSQGKNLFETEKSDDEDIFANVIKSSLPTKPANKEPSLFDNEPEDEEDLFGITRLKFNEKEKVILTNADKFPVLIKELNESHKTKSTLMDENSKIKNSIEDSISSEVHHNKPKKVVPTSIFGEEDEDDDDDFFNLLARKSLKVNKKSIEEQNMIEQPIPHKAQQSSKYNNINDLFPNNVVLFSDTNDILNKDDLKLNVSNNKEIIVENKLPKKDELFNIFSYEDADEDDIFKSLLKSPKKTAGIENKDSVIKNKNIQEYSQQDSNKDITRVVNIEVKKVDAFDRNVSDIVPPLVKDPAIKNNKFKDIFTYSDDEDDSDEDLFNSLLAKPKAKTQNPTSSISHNNVPLSKEIIGKNISDENKLNYNNEEFKRSNNIFQNDSNNLFSTVTKNSLFADDVDLFINKNNMSDSEEKNKKVNPGTGSMTINSDNSNVVAEQNSKSEILVSSESILKKDVLNLSNNIETKDVELVQDNTNTIQKLNKETMEKMVGNLQAGRDLFKSGVTKLKIESVILNNKVDLPTEKDDEIFNGNIQSNGNDENPTNKDIDLFNNSTKDSSPNFLSEDRMIIVDEIVPSTNNSPSINGSDIIESFVTIQRDHSLLNSYAKTRPRQMGKRPPNKLHGTDFNHNNIVSNQTNSFLSSSNFERTTPNSNSILTSNLASIACDNNDKCDSLNSSNNYEKFDNKSTVDFKNFESPSIKKDFLVKETIDVEVDVKNKALKNAFDAYPSTENNDSDFEIFNNVLTNELIINGDNKLLNNSKKKRVPTATLR